MGQDNVWPDAVPFRRSRQRACDEMAWRFAMHQRCSRALFDASTSATPGMKLAEKRTAIEIKITAERMQAARGMMRWCNSHQQLANGVTKSAARNWPWNCAEEFVACATTLSMWHQRRSSRRTRTRSKRCSTRPPRRSTRSTRFRRRSSSPSTWRWKTRRRPASAYWMDVDF